MVQLDRAVLVTTQPLDCWQFVDLFLKIKVNLKSCFKIVRILLNEWLINIYIYIYVCVCFLSLVNFTCVIQITIVFKLYIFVS